MKSATLFVFASIAFVQAQNPQTGPPTRPPSTRSPAAQARPKSVTPQSYSADQIREGEVRFGSQCGFCHGKDAAGGETGPDLTRADVVAKDSHGDKLIPAIRAGRPNAGMPAFPSLTEGELNAVVAFLHTQLDKFAELGGGRRSVAPSDLATGNASAGREYFQGAGRCFSCHSPTGDLAGIAKRYQGLLLLRRMLYPAGMGPAATTGKATFTLSSGQTVVSPLITADDFSVTVLDPLGARQTYPLSAVKVKLDDPLEAHFVQLGKYTDADMHDVYAYLETLK